MLVACAALTACVADKPKKKPVFFPENLPWPESDGEQPIHHEKADWEVLYQRARDASTKRLGTSADEAFIKNSLTKIGLKTDETRWLTATLVMVSGQTKTAGYIYVLQRRANQWGIIAHYQTYVK
jgi:hypothetical protein